MRLAWGLALVAAGHFVYFVGSLGALTFSAVSDLVTTCVLGLAAWRVRDASVAVPRGALPLLLLLGPLEVLDYGASIADGWFAFHWGFTLILLGALAVSGGAWKLRGDEGAAGARWLRIGAWLGAAGSAQYLWLAAEPYLFGGATSASFLLGAGAVLAGWLAVARAASAPENAHVDEHASAST